MIRRIIIFIVALMLSFSQIWVPGSGISIWFGTMDIVHRGLILQSAYAETKQISPKSSQKSISNKKESVKPELQSRKPDGLTFESNNFPDGVIGRRYSFILVPANANPPFNVTLISGTLPPGLKLDRRTGGIEGEPNQTGVYNLTLRVADSKGKRGAFSGTIGVWRSITVGEHGTLKGADGLQMALNMAQDMDEIRIEEGTYGVSGLKIPQNKNWVYGIKITGGWNETFEEQSQDQAATIFNGEGRENRILTISNSSGMVFIENLTFQNSMDGGVHILSRGAKAFFTNCTFNNNIAGYGGAVSGGGTFTNCTFTNNSASMSGGAISGGGTFIDCTFINNKAQLWGGAVDAFTSGIEALFTNCTFTNNSTHGDGGAIYGNGTFTNCTFTNNVATSEGGAVFVNGSGNFTHCTFTNNSAKRSGGAVYGDGLFTNCTFAANKADENGGAVYGFWKGSFANCIFISNSANGVRGEGGAIYIEHNGSITNSTFYSNNAKEGGAINGKGKIINSIFYKNTADGKDNDITVDGNLDIDYSLINYIKGAANFGPKNIMGDPKFVGPENGNLHIRHESPAINAGKTSLELGYGVVDIDGKPRVVGGKIDMGAYEWQGK